MTIYRRIYEQHYGPIPKDEQGRSFEIHHIDGDRNNNDISNLACMCIKEHYDTHYSQGDWGACYAIAKRMKLHPNLLSELSKKCQSKRIEERTHHLLRRQDGSSHASDRVTCGTHWFLSENGGSDRSKKQQISRVKNKTHHFLKENGGSDRSREVQKQLVKNKKHHLLKRNDGSSLSSDRVKSGDHPFVEKVVCPHCGKSGSKAIMYRHHFDRCKQKITI